MIERSIATQGQVADAVKGNWVDRLAPPITRPYLRLSRADRPIGTWLLLLPCWWGVLMACAATGGIGWTALWVMIACAAGAWLMRGAGCTWNDITDRGIDARVTRTRSRPIPSGQVSVALALAWLVWQSLMAFALLLTFNTPAIWLGIAALAPVAVYPFAKRFTWWPQVFLGLAFNWGALLGWTAVTGSLALPAVLLYLAGIAWTLFYDTIYALQDVEDDALIGVKSTARLFGAHTPVWLGLFLAACVVLMAAAITSALAVAPYPTFLIGLLGPVAIGLHMSWQLLRLDAQDTARCLTLFRSNRDAGLLVALFLAAAALV